MSNPTDYKMVSDIPDEMLQHYLAQEVIAVDTELHGLTLHRDDICLVQLCDDQANVCLVKPDVGSPPPNLRNLMESSEVLKIFHFALTDVAFFKTSLKINVQPFCCTKVMSKIIRTYTGGHGLKDLTWELIGVKLEKEQQQTDWSRSDLTPEQLKYAANDVINLVQIYRSLKAMMEHRGTLPSGASLEDLNNKSQAVLPPLIELLINGYGDLDGGWQTSLFSH
ncbi:MAG: 3'-5' exonuclease [SAR324 cluster bacterium]|nr:3'-5' exonuclease [SAR324 cluster bacterium]